jgi:protein phosphatase
MALRFCSGTDPGRRRSSNQDALLVDSSQRLFVIADGMGGHEDGDVASRIVVESIREFFADTSLDDEKTWPFGYDVKLSHAANRLKTAVLVANGRIAAHIDANGSSRGMGATLAAVQIEGERAVFANVGDCRAYLLDGKTLRQITQDHSWVAEQVQAGFISAETAKAHPWRHMVTRAVQGDPDLHVDVIEMDLPKNGQILLCSDGLYGGVSDEDIAARLVESESTLEAVCSSLIQTANDRGAPDNVSVIVVDW